MTTQEQIALVFLREVAGISNATEHDPKLRQLLNNEGKCADVLTTRGMTYEVSGKTAVVTKGSVSVTKIAAAGDRHTSAIMAAAIEVYRETK